MGTTRMGPPHKLILDLKDQFGVKQFIETGTFLGNTAVWAAAHFERVQTIEFSREIYEQTCAQHSNIPNINFHFGDSRAVLPTIMSGLTEPALFWLDGHWSGGLTYGETDECPLIDELEVINTSPHAHFLLIDDARLFLSPPQEPHRPEQWPTIAQVIHTLEAGPHRPYMVVIEDVIVAVPEAARETVIRYCVDVNTRAWQERGAANSVPLTTRGVAEIKHGMELLYAGVSRRLRGES
jgi:hypothetical protein